MEKLWVCVLFLGGLIVETVRQSVRIAGHLNPDGLLFCHNSRRQRSIRCLKGCARSVSVATDLGGHKELPLPEFQAELLPESPAQLHTWEMMYHLVECRVFGISQLWVLIPTPALASWGVSGKCSVSLDSSSGSEDNSISQGCREGEGKMIT